MGVRTSGEGPGRPGPVVPRFARLLGERVSAALVPLELGAADLVRSALELVERAGVEPVTPLPVPELAAAEWPADTPAWVRSLDSLVLGQCQELKRSLALAESALMALH
jgi:hypothetical protein